MVSSLTEDTINHGGFYSPSYPAKLLWSIIGGLIIFLVIRNHLFRFCFGKIRCNLLKRTSSLSGSASSATLKTVDWFQERRYLISNVLGYTCPAIYFQSYKLIEIPSLGQCLFIIIYLAVVIILIFVPPLSPNEYGDHAQRSLRAAYISAYQVPLIVALSGKQIALPILVRIPAERLNIYHRWVARVMFITATIHFITIQGLPKSLTKILPYGVMSSGTLAWIVLLWVVISSLAPIRVFQYELFVIVHIISITAFLILICLHVASDALPLILPGLGIFLVNRIVYAMRTSYINGGALGYSHKKLLGSYKASLVRVFDNATQIEILLDNNHHPFSWTAGQFMYLKFPTIGYGGSGIESYLCRRVESQVTRLESNIGRVESHPFSVYSVPEDGRMMFCVGKRRGFTKRLFDEAGLDSNSTSNVPVIITGPFGHPKKFQQYRTTIFLSGGTGLSYNIPMAIDFAENMHNNQQSMCFISVIKSVEDLLPYSTKLLQLLDKGSRGNGSSNGNFRMIIYASRQSSNLFTMKTKAGEHTDYKETTGELLLTDTVNPAESSNPFSDSIALENVMVDHSQEENDDREHHLFPENLSFLNRVEEVHFERPDLYKLLSRVLEGKEELTGMSICAPHKMSVEAQNAIAHISVMRMKGIAVHNEAFSL